MHHVEVGAIIHLSPSFFYPPVVGFQLTPSTRGTQKWGGVFSRIGVVPADQSVATAAGRVFVGTAG